MSSFNFDKWNTVGNYKRFDEKLLYSSESHNYLYRILKSCAIDSKFYAFENGKLLSLKGEKSYRTALRNYVLPRIIDIIYNGQSCAVASFNDYLETEILTIDQSNFYSFNAKYNYNSIINKYGFSDHTWELHRVIDDWNQIENDARDATKVNPHDIKISPNYDLTIQELHSYEWHLWHRPAKSNYFINGIPVETFIIIKQIIKDGLVIDEKPCIMNWSSFNIICDYIDTVESYTVFSDRGENNPTLEEEILLRLEKRKKLSKYMK